MSKTETSSSNKQYLSIVQGSLRQSVPEGTPEAVRREWEAGGDKGVKHEIVFKAITGVTPKAYATEMRARRAGDKLRISARVVSVAETLQTHFQPRLFSAQYIQIESHGSFERGRHSVRSRLVEEEDQDRRGNTAGAHTRNSDG